MILNAQNEYRVFTKTLLVPILLAGIYIEAKRHQTYAFKMIANPAFSSVFFFRRFLLLSTRIHIILFLVSALSCGYIFYRFLLPLKTFFRQIQAFHFYHSHNYIVLSYGIALLIWSNVTVQGSANTGCHLRGSIRHYVAYSR